MPYETVNEKVVRQRQIRVCARCRCEIPHAVNQRRMQQVGSLSGSLGASIGGSALLGSVLGPVGMIGGAIVGSLAGARAGAQAGEKVGQALEERQDSLCEACQKIVGKNTNDSSSDNPKKPDNNGSSGPFSSWGKGQRLGDGS